MAVVVEGESIEEESLWSCTLSGATREYNWTAQIPAEAVVMLLIKNTIGKPSANNDEVSVVQIEEDGFNKAKVVTVCHLKGVVDMQYRLLVRGQAKITLLQGEGPINIVGRNCVDFFGLSEENSLNSAETNFLS